MTRTFSFWEREVWLSKPDLIIIGGGIVGASIALFYKEKFPHHEVLIVDKGYVPEGASTRNAGFSCIGSMSEHLADMSIAGEETVLKRIERRWNGLQLLKKTLGEEQIGYNHTGGYEIFTDKALFQKCCSRMDDLNQQLNERIGVSNIYSKKSYEGYPAILNHLDGALNSGMLMRSLHKRIAEAGVRVWWNTNITEVRSGHVVVEDQFEVQSDQIVMATNGFTSRLTNLPIKPARGFVFITKPVEGLKWKGTFNHNEGYVYFRNVGERLLLGGARDLAKDEETTDQFGTNSKIRKYLIEFATDVIKLPEGWEIDLEWSGIMGITVNKEPIIKEVQPNVFVAAGLSGMGIAIGMQVAKELCEKMDV